MKLTSFLPNLSRLCAERPLTQLPVTLRREIRSKIQRQLFGNRRFLLRWLPTFLPLVCFALRVHLSLLYLPALAVSIVLALWGIWGIQKLKQTMIREEFAARLLCLRCGYDLTGNLSGVCPECGERI